MTENGSKTETARAQGGQGDGSTEEGPAHETILDSHAPPGWEGRFDKRVLRDALEAGQPLEMLVLAADIRKSTFVMKEAVNLMTFSEVIGGFVEVAREIAHTYGAWYDKFTGDGFLAYWLIDADETLRNAEEPWTSILQDSVFPFTREILRFFDRYIIPDLRANSRNFPSGIGLSVGLDAGPTHLVWIAGDMTVVGPTVVGAVRMVAEASPSEVLANVYLGEMLWGNPYGLLEDDAGVTVTREHRHTKEYEQEVYPVTFERT